MNVQIMIEYIKQVLQLCRIDVQRFSPLRLLNLLGAGILTGAAVFWGLRELGIDTLASHMAAGAIGATLVFAQCGRWWTSGSEGTSIGRNRLLWFLFALPLVLSVQGGVFRSLQEYGHLGELVAFAGGSTLSCGVLLTIMVVFVFSGFASLANQVKLRLAAFGLICFVVLIRLAYLGLPELMEQEAYYWNYAQHPDLSYLDHPPLTAALIWCGTAVFGVSEFGVRIGAYLCWFVTAYFSYRLTARIFGRTAGLGAVLLLGYLPLYYGIGLIMTPDAPLHAAWSALLYYLYAALVEEQADAWMGIGISLGLGMIAKYTIVLLGPAVFFFIALDRRSWRWVTRSEPFGALLLALLFLLPVLIWNMQHDWASFLFQGQQRVTGRTFFTTHRLAGYICLLLTPAGVLGACYFFLYGNRFFKRMQRAERVTRRAAVHRGYLLMLLCTLSPLLVFLFFSFTREVKLNWTSPLWLALIPFLACTLMAMWEQGTSRFLKVIHKLWLGTMAILLLAWAVSMHYVTIGLPGVPHPPGPFLIGWEGLARDIEMEVERVEQQRGRRPIVVGMDPYQISSGLAFYRTKALRDRGLRESHRGVEETAGWHLFGWNSLMYRYWADPEDYYGRDIIAVASSQVRVEFPYYQHRISSMAPIQTLDAVKDKQPVRRFYYRLLFGYRQDPRQ